MIGFPFDSYVTFDEHGQPEYDRAISSQPLKNLLHRLFTDGILPDVSSNLEVIAGEGMTINVKPGFCIIQGGLKLEEELRILSIQASSSSYSRIDTVVMRWNDNVDYRICDLYILQGEPAANPVRPELTREGGIYELGLADILIPANSTVISDSRITDTRYDSARCGVISSLSEFDTTFIYNQVTADLNEYRSGVETDFTTWVNAQTTAYENWIAEAESNFGNWEGGLEQEFNDWFDTIRGILDEEAAGHLQNEIDALSETVSGYDERITDAEETVGSLSTTVSELQTQLTNDEADISALATTVAGHTTALASHDTRILANTDDIAFDNTWVDFTLNSGSWSSSTFTINGQSYYRLNSSNPVTRYESGVVDVMLIPYNSTYSLPSATEEENYNKIDYVVLNTDDNLLYFYAKEKPTTTLKVKLHGVSWA